MDRQRQGKATTHMASSKFLSAMALLPRALRASAMVDKLRRYDGDRVRVLEG